MSDFSRRLALAGGLAGAAIPALAGPAAPKLDARQFGALGDGQADDTGALQKALDQTFDNGGGVLVIPPGTYRLTRTLRIGAGAGKAPDITRHNGIIAHGARFLSQISGGPVLEVTGRGNHRFLLIEGLDVLGSGRETHGIVLQCERGDAFLYNFCLRDVVVQDCGGDGLHLSGNVFEGQIVNAYCRKNRGNGVSFMHGTGGGVLSAVHVFASVFAQSGSHGAAMLRDCYDVAFHGCYFLENARYGLDAGNGCTLLSNCGFENNHIAAGSFAKGGTGISLKSFGILVGCMAVSRMYQTGLIDAFVTGPLTMTGCSGGGVETAAQAGLGTIDGTPGKGSATLVGCKGAVSTPNAFPVLALGGEAAGGRFGAGWNSHNLLQLGDYALWVAADGKLRMKKGQPTSDTDGAAVG